MNKNAAKEHQSKRIESEGHYIIGVGASAGGLEAIHELFDNFPSNTNFSFVIVQHLSPDYKSLMTELLSKHTQMRVSEAEDGMLILPNRVYVLPSRKVMTVKNGKLQLTEKPTSYSPNMAIDLFLRSLANERGKSAIAIIMSGTGSDGTLGIEAIKKAGGLVIVQDPATAKFDGMPNSAIASGNTDYILPPELMSDEIFNYLKQGALLKNMGENSLADEESVLSEIIELIKENTNHDFTYYKRHTIARRISKRMAHNNIDQLSAYVKFLKKNASEIEQLSKEFLIGVTKFFRDNLAFDIIKKKVVPSVFDGKVEESEVKFWTVACSTGEEAYSMAILVDEYLSEINKSFNIKIFATDVDKEAVTFAAKGVYSNAIEKDVSSRRLEKYFIKQGKFYLVNQHIRKMVIFANHNVIKDPPFSKIDLVSCRNMLIYMNPILQNKVLNTLHFSLKVGGFLFLGSSENSGELKSYLTDVSKRWNIYQNSSESKKFIFDTNFNYKRDYSKHFQINSKNLLSSKTEEVFTDFIVEEFGYAGVYIDENYDVIQATGDYKRYIQLPDKKLQFNLLKMVPHELSVALGVGIRKAVKKNEKVVSTGVRIASGRHINYAIKPFLQSNDSGKFIFVFFFEERKNSGLINGAEAYDDHLEKNQRLTDLENELKETKENLHAAVEELETSNEELQSSNEELLSSNEELQSTNEELQSLNEELHTVNAEHQLKIKELMDLNDDLNNYFRSTDIGQIFIDKNLIIRKYTPEVRNQINIIESDIGRPINHFSFNIKYDNFISDIHQVIRTSEIIEREIEVNNNKNKVYLMRILPYIRQDKSTDGVVITFVDISALKYLNNLISGVFNSSLNAIMAFNVITDEDGKPEDFAWILASKATEKLIKKNPDRLVGKRLSQELPGLKKVGIFDKLIEVAEKDRAFRNEYYLEYDNICRWIEFSAVKIPNGVTITLTDIEEKKSAENELLAAYEDLKKAEENLKKLNSELEERVDERTMELSLSEERFRLVSLATNDAIRDWNLASNKVWWNESFRIMFGYKDNDLEPGIASWAKFIHKDDKDRVVESLNEAINSGAKQWAEEYRFRRADGSFSYVLERAYIIHNENKTPYRLIGSLVDLSKLKNAENELKKTNENLIRINNDLDNFIYTASHDLKAPILNLEGLVDYLKKEIKEENQNLNFIIELIDKSVHRFKNTINDLTEISKVQKNIYDDIDEINLYDIIDNVMVNIREMLLSSNAKINIDLHECHKLKFSKKNLYSVVYNLVNNAIKYRSPDRELLVEVTTEVEDGYIKLSVSDNGLGIKKSKLQDVFSMFRRFHDHVEGTGLGLYIIKRIMENAGGKIEVESEVDKGTTFSAYFLK